MVQRFADRKLLDSGEVPVKVVDLDQIVVGEYTENADL